MTIWVDADACPKVVKEILFKAANRKEVELILVANHYMQVPKSKWIRFIQVEQGFDVADNYIVQNVIEGDLCITQDIPLADELLDAGAQVLTPRGDAMTKQNIKQRLNMRDFMETMRSSAVEMKGGPAAFGQKDKQSFANSLDRYLAKL